MLLLLLIIMLLLITTSSTDTAALLIQLFLLKGDYPFRNVSLPWEERVDDLVGRLTLEEIQQQMGNGGSGG